MLGIGDDCAIFRPRGSAEDLLFTTDMLIEGVHFLRETHTAEEAGWKCLARGLSDIAAMGGEPRFCLLSLALAAGAADSGAGLPQVEEAAAGAAARDDAGRWAAGFYRGLLRLARSTGTALMGGDVARSSKMMADIVVCGAVPRGMALRRDGAREGDAIYVSGKLGGSALGLALGPGASRGTPSRRGAWMRKAWVQKAWTRHARPEPRLALGRFLRERLHATAAMDLSDGLSMDLHRMCLASGLEAEIHEPPRYPHATLEQALHGGEDYELLFTVAERASPAVAARRRVVPRASAAPRRGAAPREGLVPLEFDGIPLTRIGTMRKGRRGVVELNGAPLEPLGHDHFRNL